MTERRAQPGMHGAGDVTVGQKLVQVAAARRTLAGVARAGLVVPGLVPERVAR